MTDLNPKRYSLTRKTGIIFLSLIFILGIPAGFSFAYEVNKKAIVLLITKGPEGKELSTGTGFIVKPDGTLITNYHVLVDAASVDAIFDDGNVVPIKGILKVDRIKDFSLLRLADGIYSTMGIGNSDGIGVYDYAAALGYPSQGVEKGPENWKGNLLQVHGFVLGLNKQAFPDFSYIYTTTPFVPGFSGGPLVNRDNQVIGLATLEGRSINLALPINHVKPFLNENRLISFDQLREEDKTSKEAMYYRGNFALYAMGEPQTAMEFYNKSLGIDPNFVLAHYDLAVAHRERGDLDRCIAAYEKVLEIQPRFPEALSNLGSQYFRKGQTEKAIGLFKKAIEVYPNFIQALSNLGASLNKLGRAEEALPHLEKALALDPEFAVTYYNLGNSLFAAKKYVKARQAYDNAIKQGIDFLSLHWRLFEISEIQGRKKEAIDQLKIILQIDPKDEKARKKLEALQGRR
ncbi:MAG: tetratricopeptide repeat protein [Nitrospinae bacterium]|nr:tetratricopeptide repeat protein [Nitrospinota bacterium]